MQGETERRPALLLGAVRGVAGLCRLNGWLSADCLQRSGLADSSARSLSKLQGVACRRDMAGWHEEAAISKRALPWRQKRASVHRYFEVAVDDIFAASPGKAP